MSEHAEVPSRPASEIHAALLAYFHAPGKYQLRRRQPAILFESIRDVLHIAAGRVGANNRSTVELREAAGFFLRAALLFPGADHYAVLGLPARKDPVELKERYRLLMRLIHPDFVDSRSAPWPSDAAVRVNRAYEVLSSPMLRKEYDEQLDGDRAARGPCPAAMERPARAQVRPRYAPKGRFLNNRTAWMLGLGAAILLAYVVAPSSDPVQLVQKAPPPPTAKVVAPVLTVQAGRAGVIREPEPFARPGPAAPAAEQPPASYAPSAIPAERPRTQVPGSTSEPAPVAAERSLAKGLAPASSVLHATEPPTARALPVAAVGSTEEARSAIRSPTRPDPGLVPPDAPAAKLAAALPLPHPAGPTLGEVQPLLTQLLQSLETGSGEQVLRLLDDSVRQDPSAQQLSRYYEHIVRGARPVRLSHAEFKGEQRNGVLLVTGRVRLHAGVTVVGSHGEPLLIRAEFASRGGKIALTSLGGGVD